MLSTLILTLLLMVGLFFFIRASVKDRTEMVKLKSLATEDTIFEYFQQYFQKRAYKVVTIDEAENKVTFEGFVAPSIFLAILLSFLAACGFFCLNLVLYFLYPDTNNLGLLLITLSPLAGIFYWRNAGRIEKVALQLESNLNKNEQSENIITLIAHRDELIELQKTFPF
jgi:Flp pilus assembly protein TadB